MKNASFFFLLILCIALAACKESDDPGTSTACPPFDIIFSSPYTDPVWHPSGEFIGFNYTPLKRITYTYGYDCPNHAQYEVDPDSIGFYLVNADGSNQRMVLPYHLGTPDWSPNGKWIAFSNSQGTIYKMPFNGAQFDTSSIVQLTFEGAQFLSLLESRWEMDRL